MPESTLVRASTFFLCLFAFAFSALGADGVIPDAAWRTPIGQPPRNPGGKKPNLSIIDDGYWQGAPVGGLGAGTFSRTNRGAFERWHLKTGVHKYAEVPGDQFAVFVQPQGGAASAVVLSTAKPEGNALSAWNWGYQAGTGEYAALYPKAWYSYAALPIKLTIEQFSPVLPNNYKESSYPVAIYNWYAENPGSTPVTVSLLFSWTNMTGWFRDQTRGFSGALSNQDLNHHKKDAAAEGIVFDRLRSGPLTDEWDGQFALAADASGADVTYYTTFDPTTPAAQVWQPFAKDGRLPNIEPPIASAGEQMAGAIAVRFTLQPGEKKRVPMALAWDYPIVQFGGGRKWVRHYTRFFDTSGTNAWKIAETALQNNDAWSKQIDEWQRPYVEDASKPLWYRGELFNELYDVADAGSLWGYELGKKPASPNDDTFDYLECFDYSYYSSSDVRFYGSFPLIRFWPELEKRVMRTYTATLPEANTQRYVWGWKAANGDPLATIQRKVAGVMPHDLGSPAEDPFVNPNQYNYQDLSDWRDLNSKYVLMIWRDYVLSGARDTAFLRDSWKAVQQAMQHLRRYDKNGDGLIANGGFPDQTYDNWIASGESAYCGGLYLAALRASAEMARKLGDTAAAASYDALFKRAQKAYIDHLWNGSYFNYDTLSSYKTDIMAEQLAGQWYASLTGLGDLVPENMRHSALQRVFDYNVMKFNGGTMGAVNGIGADGQILHDNEQVEEVWTGTTFGVASHMLVEGMRDQAFHTAEGVYNVVWKERGYYFRTPEAYDSTGMYRASMYMRPGSIWAMEYALQSK